VTAARRPTPRRASLLLRAGLAMLLLPCLASCWISGRSPSAAPSSVGAAVSAPRYVSPDGRDTWAGTKSHPWKTLGRALPAILPGQVLYVRGGVYRENLVRLNVHQGTAAHRVLVTAYPGERPVVKGILWLFRPSFWTLNDINVTWDSSLTKAPRAMVKVTGGVGWTWQNSEIWGSHAAANVLVAGFGRREPSRWTLSGNCIHDLTPSTRRSSNLTIGPMRETGLGTVTRNLLYNAPGPQNVALGSHAVGGPNDVDLSYNTLYGSKVAVAFAGDARNTTVERNIFAGVTSGVAIRWTDRKGSGNDVRQNLAILAKRLMRPAAEQAMGGPGNVVRNDVLLRHRTSCGGFSSRSPATFPYGRDALG
jgi:hypothetical protein